VIEVGAGSYGDLNGDGAFTAPGEEHYSTSSGGNGVHVDFNSTGVKVIGNTDRGNAGSGFAVDVVDESVPVPFPVPISQYTVIKPFATAAYGISP
jgi:hypothetical protein